MRVRPRAIAAGMGIGALLATDFSAADKAGIIATTFVVAIIVNHFYRRAGERRD